MIEMLIWTGLAVVAVVVVLWLCECFEFGIDLSNGGPL